MRRYIIAALAVLSFIPSAAAAPPDLAALGYTVYRDGDPFPGGVCPKYTVQGFGADVFFRAYNGLTCNESAMEESMHSFAAGHDERKLGFENAPAVSARSALQSKGYTVTTSYAGPSFRVVGDCNVDQTVDSATIVTLASSLPTSAPCPPPPPAEEPPPPPVDPAVDARLRALEEEIARLRAEHDQLRAEFDAHVGAMPGASIEEATRFANAIMDAS